MPEAIMQLTAFHFIRPYWLLALVLIPLLFRLAKNHRGRSSSWAQAIDQPLLAFLLEPSAGNGSRTPLRLAALAIALTALALAGPAWQKLPQPVHKSQDALVILLDLSLSMQANDIKPSRLVKARHKIIDILEQRKQGLTALVAYAGDAHIVAPLTDDTGTVAALVPALSPLIMPALGSRPGLALELAQQLLHDGGVNRGQILLVTDGITVADAERLAELHRKTPHHISILAVGTPEGGPIPLPEQGFLKDGLEIVIAKTELEPMQQLARDSGGRIAQLQMDDSDINYLLPEDMLEFNKASRLVEREFDQWQEQGPWLLLLLTPLVAFVFRRGWLFSLVFLVLLKPPAAHALEWRDLWQTKEQQAAAAFAEGDHERAAQLFESDAWKGSAAYRAGDYQQAVDAFARQDSGEAHYNRGNALAKAGKLQEAVAAYGKALRLAPDLEDAQFNKQLVEQLLQNQQQNPQQNQDDNQQQDQNNQQQDQNNSQDRNQDNNPSQPQDGNQQPDGNPENSPPPQQDSSDPQQEQRDPSRNDNQNNEQESQPGAEEEQQQPTEQPQAQPPESSDQQKQEPKQQPSPDREQSAEQNQQLSSEQIQQQMSEEQRQATEQWLRRIPEDPGGLLRRKFNYQYRQRQLENQFQPQQEGEPIW